ncbi:unnamed protein product [Thlaspi arvense]|uniref:Uncharacterized protein n=1 Tax=Thlaspi arvense TaxID=13288 RepID=A0AAU9SX11_THLAR|nr:unnamed protein product [Thlaspi arvense]
METDSVPSTQTRLEQTKNMYRSASWNRVTEDYSVPWSAPKGLWKGLDEDEPALYDPTGQEVTKKEKSRAKFAENAVHIIPFVLLACALVLWFFSNPVVGVGFLPNPY